MMESTMLTLQKKRNVIVRIAVMACFLATVLFSSAEIAVAQRVHLVTLCDSKSSISESCKVDIFNIEYTLDQGWTNKTVTALTTEIRASGLLQKIASLPVGRGDVLFFYYAGHGYCDAQRRHHLSMNYTQNDADTLPRTQLREALLAKRARLTILVTDCCDDIGTVEGTCAAATPDLERNLRRLFSATGLVDINSSSPGEIAWGVESFDPDFGFIEEGGLFTQTFHLAFYQNSDWKAVFASVSEGTKGSFDVFKEDQEGLLKSPDRPGHIQARRNWTVLGLERQVSQTPWKLSLPREMAREYGIRIREVFPATTAANLRDEQGSPARLKPNDIIYKVTYEVEVAYGVIKDTETIINNETHLPNVISQVKRNGEIELKVLDADTGLWKYLTGNVDYGTRARFGVSLRTD